MPGCLRSYVPAETITGNIGTQEHRHRTVGGQPSAQRRAGHGLASHVPWGYNGPTMDEVIPARACRACGTAAAAEANYCHHCGKTLHGPGARWYHNVWIVLAMIFFVLGPFALPLVWSHPRFSRVGKVCLSALTLIYTAWIIILIQQMIQTVTEHFNQLNATLGF